MTDESVVEDRQLERFLLGLLPDDEAERLEELSIVDNEVAWRLKAAENDLVDAYVSGQLRGETLQRFESSYLSSPIRRQKVTFARTLLLDEPNAVRVATSRFSGRTGWTAQWSLLAATVALLLLAGVLFVRDLRTRQALTRVETDRAALEQRVQTLQQQLEAQRAANASAPVVPAPPRPSGDAPAIVALTLLPPTRGSGAHPALAIPAGAARVAIDLRIDADGFSRYDVALKDLDTNQIVWRSGRLAAKAAGNHTSVIVTIPANTLTPRRYALDVTGRRAGGNDELIASYPFQVLGA